MERYRVQTRCECQAALSAVLDENRHVLSGTAARAAHREVAPGHSIDSDSNSGRFDVAWLCPFCGRNTLRTFYVGALTSIRSKVAPPSSDGELPP